MIGDGFGDTVGVGDIPADQDAFNRVSQILFDIKNHIGRIGFRLIIAYMANRLVGIRCAPVRPIAIFIDRQLVGQGVANFPVRFPGALRNVKGQHDQINSLFQHFPADIIGPGLGGFDNLGAFKANVINAAPYP